MAHSAFSVIVIVDVDRDWDLFVALELVAAFLFSRVGVCNCR